MDPVAAAAEADPASTSDPLGLWVFGYGSLCWHPGFDFRRSVNGFVKGYARKFWQGNTTHRGTEAQPGRVATLVEEKDVFLCGVVDLTHRVLLQGIVWGRAFELSGEAALPYLANRECKLGGYITKFATFFPKRPCTDDGALMPTQPFPALLYVATPSNRLWLGDAPLQQIAQQIVSCSGATGHNVEYLLRLADYMRAAAPEADDCHLFSLEELVRHEIRQRRLCLDALMGSPLTSEAQAVEATVLDDDDEDSTGDEDGREAIEGAAAPAHLRHPYRQHHHPVEQQQPVGAPQQEAAVPGPVPDFASRVPNKKLRCLNIT